MNDEITFTAMDMKDSTDITSSKTATDFTQVASCVMSRTHKERRRQSLRAKLEREQFVRKQEVENSFITTFRSLFKNTG